MTDMSKIEFTSRYDVFGAPNGCDGDCEGTGFVPIHKDETDPTYKALWRYAEARNLADDGWHFVPCPKCHPDAKKHLKVMTE